MFHSGVMVLYLFSRDGCLDGGSVKTVTFFRFYGLKFNCETEIFSFSLSTLSVIVKIFLKKEFKSLKLFS